MVERSVHIGKVVGSIPTGCILKIKYFPCGDVLFSIIRSGIEPQARIFKELRDYKNSASRPKGEAIPTGCTL